MSWEECGFKPGKVHGPATCRRCSDCDGEHHFYAESIGPDGIDPEDLLADVKREAIASGFSMFFSCKHCEAWAEMVDEDEDDDEAPFVCPGCHAVGAEPHAADCIDAAIEREREDDRQRSFEFDEEEP